MLWPRRSPLYVEHTMPRLVLAPIEVEHRVRYDRPHSARVLIHTPSGQVFTFLWPNLSVEHEFEIPPSLVSLAAEPGGRLLVRLAPDR